MGKTIANTWTVLMILTITTALISMVNTTYTSGLILVLATFKFLIVAFQFMELKRAHFLWKFLILSYIILFTIIIFIVAF
ncbi:cytochrome C oxidase subunit IV family protein [Flagellimonas nanhaiensis]|uniref:Cytochrome C oxidase subunit IV n=1 Tax=Flagellimonas nanhaiensis TaxID=2292706 RepID=A0A371JP75_9FLAO|nr:cytochrome C oxidase subunit IV family protein [Allomuricauda nanhaiensis]RDY59309.1 hypothetical protein DX873_07885 [Allomuricauda nanhaiensis]